MGRSHGHSHGIPAAGTGTAKHRKRLIAVLSITLAVVLTQVVGAAISGSLALLADAGHIRRRRDVTMCGFRCSALIGAGG